MKPNAEEEVLKRFIALNPPRRRGPPLASVLRLMPSRPLSIEGERERLLRQERELIEAEKAEFGPASAGQMYLYHALQERVHRQAKEFARAGRRAG
jgi:hypothetical protein